MANRTVSKKALPSPLKEILRQVGQNLKIARKRRGMTQKELAHRIFCSIPTIKRLEEGDAGVSLNVLIQALWIFGLQEQLRALASPGTDDTGMQFEIQRLPKTVRKPGKTDMDF